MSSLTAFHLGPFEPTPRNGSRYDLVLVEHPYGGTLVIWSSANMTWRYDRDDRMKPLSPNCNSFDAEAIFNHLQKLDEVYFQ